MNRIDNDDLLNKMHDFPKDIRLRSNVKKEIEQEITAHMSENPRQKRGWKKTYLNSLAIMAAVCIITLLSLTFVTKESPKHQRTPSMIKSSSRLSETDIIKTLQDLGIKVKKGKSRPNTFFDLLGQTPALYKLGSGRDHLLIYTFNSPEEVQKALKQFDRQTQTMDMAMNVYTAKNLLIFYGWGSSDREYSIPIIKILSQLEPLSLTKEDALKKVLEKNSEFPNIRIGENVDESDVHIGGPQGTVTHITYSADVKGSHKEGYIVTLKKDWHLTVNDQLVVSTFIWGATAENIILLSVDNRDELANIIK